MKHILRITGNYADEFDVYGIHEITSEQAEFLMFTNAACLTSEAELYFGTNEAVQLNDLQVTMDTLSNQEYEAVKYALGCGSILSYGMIDLTDVIEEAMDQ